MEFVTSHFDDGKSLVLIFLDFSKDFDKVPNNRLVKKTEAHGIYGKILKLQNKLSPINTYVDPVTWFTGVQDFSSLNKRLLTNFMNIQMKPDRGDIRKPYSVSE